MATKRGLGKGLDSMIPKRTKKSPDGKDESKVSSSEGIQSSAESNKSEKDMAKGIFVSDDFADSTGISEAEQANTGEILAEGQSSDKILLSVDMNKNGESDKQEIIQEEFGTDKKYVKITKVEPNRSQPRKLFNEDSLQELAESIRQFGILQPLLVSDKKTYYEIIAGERRWRAAKLAGLKEIPVIIKEYTEQEIVEISLIENIQREDLNPIEEAKAFRRLIDDFGLLQDEVADRVSKSRTAITNSMRLLKLDDKVQQMVIDEMISAGHARALLALPEGELQEKIAMQIFDEKLSVRETEKIVKSLTNKSKQSPASEKKAVNLSEQALYEDLENKIKTIMGTKVQIQRKSNNKGKIEIEYYSKEELERIIDLIESIG